MPGAAGLTGQHARKQPGLLRARRRDGHYLHLEPIEGELKLNGPRPGDLTGVGL